MPFSWTLSRGAWRRGQGGGQRGMTSTTRCSQQLAVQSQGRLLARHPSIAQHWRFWHSLGHGVGTSHLSRLMCWLRCCRHSWPRPQQQLLSKSSLSCSCRVRGWVAAVEVGPAAAGVLVGQEGRLPQLDTSSAARMLHWLTRRLYRCLPARSTPCWSTLASPLARSWRRL